MQQLERKPASPTRGAYEWFARDRATLFVRTAGVIFGITGIAKILSASGGVKVLKIEDPIFQMKFGTLLVAAGIAELFLCFCCLLFRKSKLPAALVAFAATNLLAYRVLLWRIGWKMPCMCLGTFTDAIHMSPYTADLIIKIALIYLLIGSYGVLIKHWLESVMVFGHLNRRQF